MEDEEGGDDSEKKTKTDFVMREIHYLSGEAWH